MLFLTMHHMLAHLKEKKIITVLLKLYDCGLVERHQAHNQKVVSSSPSRDCPLWSLGNSIYPTFLTPPVFRWVPEITGRYPATD